MLVFKSRFACAAALLLATFCAHSQQPLQTASINASNSSLLRGKLLLSTKGGMHKIALCDNSQQVAVQLDPKLLQQALKFYDEQRPIYIEAIGNFTKPAKKPVFAVNALNLFSSEINLCLRPTEQSRAFGGPAWSVVISDQELLYTPRGAKEQRFKITNQKNSQSELHLQAAKGADLKITQGFCNDGMSDSVFGWKATFTLAGKRMQGCARLTPQTMGVNVIENKARTTL
ncbi:MAG: hypothetical protein ACRC9R_08340 [Enterovibrio sp.]